MPKSVYGNLYVHRRFLKTLPPGSQQIVSEAAGLLPESFQWNIVRVNPVERDLTFSCYPDFEENPHPELRSWKKIDLAIRKIKSGSYPGDNPFILHHKEAFIDESDPLYKKFRDLSLEEERAGLYEPPHFNRIGKKFYWENLLYEKGLVITDHHLIKGESKPAGAPQLGLFTDKDAPIGGSESLTMSGKTAMHRSELSLPATILVQRKMVDGKLFDWGCGHGADLECFRKSGIETEGWDPNHKPEKPPQSYPSGIFNWVYCGYVLNTLPDPSDRVKVLKDIYDFLPRDGQLAIAVRSVTEIESVRKSTWKRYGDGWLTSKNTFQKGFTAGELKSLLERNGFTVSEIVIEEPVVFIIAKCDYP